MSKEALKIGVDLGTEKDEQCAVIILHYDGIDHIIYETHDKEQIEALNKIKQQESIDNANPSEALNVLKATEKYTGIDLTVVKNALLKAQEPKQYLKWEDLEFKHTPKMTDVKMNDNKYKLVVGYNVTGKHLAILRDGKKEYYFLECDKQFFNDLRLERVE